MKKQTATEWLFAHLLPFLPFSDVKEREHFRKCLEGAKAMEKEQIEDAHIEGQRVFDKHPHTQWTNDQAEQYYNETYKGGDNETL